MALVALDSLKQMLGLDLADNTADPQLLILRDAAEKAVEMYCNREFAQKEVVEYHTGTGQPSIVLLHRPVVSILNLWVDYDGDYDETDPDPSYGPGTLLEPSADYVLERDGSWGGSPVSFCGVVNRRKTVWLPYYRTYQPGRLVAEGGPTYGSIKVQYVGGYAPVPDDLAYAIALYVATMRRVIPWGGKNVSERIGDYSYTLLPQFYRGLQQPEMASVRQVLARYREVSL